MKLVSIPSTYEIKMEPVLYSETLENTEEKSATINLGSKKDKRNFVPHNMVPHTTFDKISWRLDIAAYSALCISELTFCI
jgi:hypothetical protein